MSLTTISYGGGVQSTALGVLAALPVARGVARARACAWSPPATRETRAELQDLLHERPVVALGHLEQAHVAAL